MPNHIQNKLRAIGDLEETKKFFDFIKSDECSIDFNKIIPMPESLNITSGSLGDIGLYVLTGKSDNKFINHDEIKNFLDMPIDRKIECIELGIQYYRNKEKYGYTTWYEWAIKNWGTKWNAYQTPDERDTGDTIYFQTAWACVVDLIIKISLMFPEIELHYDWSDENTGSNVGSCIIKNGNIISEIEFENYSTDSYEKAFELWPDSKQYYKLVNGRYEYIEE